MRSSDQIRLNSSDLEFNSITPPPEYEMVVQLSASNQHPYILDMLHLPPVMTLGCKPLHPAIVRCHN